MKKNKGFTLIELLAVIVILGILLSISIVAVNNIRKKQELENKLNVLSGILTGAKSYIVEHPNFWNGDIDSCDNNNWNTGAVHCGSDEITGRALQVESVADYADFDKTKYPEWYNRSMIVRQCSNNKYEVILDYATYDANKEGDGHNYSDKFSISDCGCEEQAISEQHSSFKFCDANHPGAGWDSNGKYYNDVGTNNPTMDLTLENLQ